MPKQLGQNKKRMCGEFLMEVALDDWRGLSLRESAKQQNCSMGTVHNARKHQKYEAIYEDVSRLKMAERVAG